MGQRRQISICRFLFRREEWMKKRSHKLLGIYLAERYMDDATKACRKAFVFGCVEPDYNYASYLKGWGTGNRVKGHNYECACHYIRKNARYLSEKHTWNLWDYYQFGRMLHYLADAFTFPHNSHYEGTLANHVRYELEMQPIFLEKLKDTAAQAVPVIGSRAGIVEELNRLHRDYRKQASNPERDCDIILQTLCMAAAFFVPSAEYRHVQVCTN